MLTGKSQEALRLTEEEAYAILNLCLTSPMGLDKTSEQALKKLAEYCSHTAVENSHHSHQLQEIRCVS